MVRKGFLGLLLAAACCCLFGAPGVRAQDKDSIAPPAGTETPAAAPLSAGIAPEASAAATATPAASSAGLGGEEGSPAAPAGSTGGETLEKRLLSLSLTGARALLVLLLVLSVLCVGVALERVVLYHRENPLGPGFRARLADLLERNDLPSALRAVENVRGVNAALVREGLLNFQEGAAAIEEIVASRLILERARLERRLLILGTIGNNAPFIGLLGTVMGIVKAFHDLSTAATQGPQAVMAGISEALIATAVGLFVAIPAVVLFNWLKSRSKGLLEEAEANAKIVLAYAKRTKEANRGGQGPERK